MVCLSELGKHGIPRFKATIVAQVHVPGSRRGGRDGERYSGTTINGHPSTADTHDITDTFDCPDRISIDFNTLKIPEERTPRYSIKRTLLSIPMRLRCSE